VILLGVGLIVNQQNKRIDHLRDSMNKRIDDLTADVKELREKVDELPLKIMELLCKALR